MYYCQTLPLSLLLPSCCAFPVCHSLCFLYSSANHSCLFEFWLTALIGFLWIPPHESDGVGCVNSSAVSDWLQCYQSLPWHTESVCAVVCMGESMCSNTLWQVHSYSAPFSSSYTKTQRCTEKTTCYVMGCLLWKWQRIRELQGGWNSQKGKRNASGRH